MNPIQFVLLSSAAFLATSPLLHADGLTLGRVLGQSSLTMNSAAPNIVEGREFSAPQGLALDTSVSPSRVYVSDTGNNRVLVWHDATAFSNGATADFAIGQSSLIGTGAGKGNAGLNGPTGLFVDAQGNLWVADSRNNRVLRFPKPFAQTANPKTADVVIGQPDFNGTASNNGGISAKTLYLAGYVSSLAMDASGNLWVTDTGNHRVLRYPSSGSGKVDATANLVVGQRGKQDFTLHAATSNVNMADLFNRPMGLAVDATSLYVSDAAHRVLVFKLGTTAATAYLGEVISTKGGVLAPPTKQSLNMPAGVALNPKTGEVLVSDTGNNRVLVFPKAGSWAHTPPDATAVIGQGTLLTNFATAAAGIGASALSGPVQLAATATEVFIADSTNNRVVVFPQASAVATRVLGQTAFDVNGENLIEGRELDLAAQALTAAGKYQTVFGGVAVDRTAAVPRLYIADPGNNRVLGYCSAWKAKQGDKADLAIGQPDVLHSQANGDGGVVPNDQYLSAPAGVAVDAAGNLFVADAGNGRVLRFPAPCAQPAGHQSFLHANLVLGQPDFKTREKDLNESSLDQPASLAVTNEGYLLVADFAQNRVLRFEKPAGGDFRNGQSAAAVFGQQDFVTAATGTDNNRFGQLRQIAVDASGRLYAADTKNNRVMIFGGNAASRNATASNVILTPGPAATVFFRQPQGVCLNPATGELWVSEANGYRSDSSGTRYRLLRFPAYTSSTLVSNASIDVASPAYGCALDANGDVFAAESGNRISEYFPTIQPFNSASQVTTRALTAGLLATVFTPFRSVATASASTAPLPRALGGAQVFVNGVAAPMLYVGNGKTAGVSQINFQVPTTVPSSGGVDMQVVDATTGQVFGAAFIPLAAAAPAFFTVDGSGSGQVVATNVKDQSCNGKKAGPTSKCPHGTRPAGRGETVALWMTGQGPQTHGPADGTAAAGNTPNDGPAPQLWIGAGFVPAGNVQYTGAAIGAPGIWQMSVKIPNTVGPGLPNPIFVIYRDILSMYNGTPATTIQIQ